MTLTNEERGLEGEELPWPVLRALVLLRDEFTCAICGEYATQADHIWPRCYGGSDNPLNLQALCRPCNQRKGRSILGDGSWIGGFLHLTFDQLVNYRDEAQAYHERLAVEQRVYSERVEDLEAGIARPGDPLNLERHGMCPRCSGDGHYTLHNGAPCPRQKAAS